MASRGHIDVVDRLLVSGTDVNIADVIHGQTALHTAARNGHITVIDRLLLAGTDVNARTRDNGRTALHEAACSHNDNVQIIDRLLSTGADIEATTLVDKSTTLHEAVRKNNLKVVDRLLQANVNAVTYDFQIPLGIATSTSTFPAVASLLRAVGAIQRINIQDARA